MINMYSFLLAIHIYYYTEKLLLIENEEHKLLVKNVYNRNSKCESCVQNKLKSLFLKLFT